MSTLQTINEVTDKEIISLINSGQFDKACTGVDSISNELFVIYHAEYIDLEGDVDCIDLYVSQENDGKLTLVHEDRIFTQDEDLEDSLIRMLNV